MIKNNRKVTKKQQRPLGNVSGDVQIEENSDVKQIILRQLKEFLRNHHRELAALNYDKWIREVFNSGNIFSEDRKGKTLLHLAAKYDDVELAKALIESGLDLNKKDHYKNTPLHYAALHGSKGVVKLLVERGADVKERNSLKETPLHKAAISNDPEVTIILLEVGVEVNAQDNLGNTPLHNAVKYGGHVQLIELLLEHGADPLMRNNEGETPISLALKNGKGGIAALLKEKAKS